MELLFLTALTYSGMPIAAAATKFASSAIQSGSKISEMEMVEDFSVSIDG